MPLADPYSWKGVFGHLIYAVNHDGSNGLGRWSTESSALSIPIPLGWDEITRTYGTTISDTNRRVTWDQDLWSMGVASVSATLYTLIGRWDLGLDIVAEVQIDIQSVLRNLGAAFLRHKRSQNPQGARDLVGAVDTLTQVFPSFNLEGRFGVSIGISQEGRGYVRLSTFGGASLNLQLPGEFSVEMGSWDDMGRHWQITLSNLSGHIPSRI